MWPSSSQTSSFSGRSSAASGCASMTGVPAAGLPKMIRTVSRSSMPARWAAARWSIVAKTVMPRSVISPVSRSTVSATGQGLSFVV